MPLDRLGLLGHPDRAHAAFADLLEQLVRADHACRALRDRRRRGRSSKRSDRRGVSRRLPARSWARSSASTCAAQLGVRRRRPRPGTRPARSGRYSPRRPAKIVFNRHRLPSAKHDRLATGQCDDAASDALQPRTKISRLSDRLASGHLAGAARPGRRPSAGAAVTREMPRASAACSIVRPAKYRSLTSRALTGSSSFQLGRALRRERGGRLGGKRVGSSASSTSTRSCPPPCLSRFLRRAASDQDAAHGLGGGGEEVAAASPSARSPPPTSRR